MSKLIFLTFGFLGLAFYELSGGADFNGEELRLSRVETGGAKQGLPKVANARLEPTVQQTDLTVTRASFNMIDKEDFQVIKAVNAKPAVAITQTGLAVEDGKATSHVLILPSLIAQPVSNAPIEVAPSAIVQDIRIVAGNRVNVRGGPSTDFGVVGKLTRGTEVEVVADNEDGWVKMRSINGETTGWMADFLLN